MIAYGDRMASSEPEGGPADPFPALTERFRSWYGELEDAEVSARDPVLIVSPSAAGGSYSLLAPGQEVTVSPVPVRFVALRAIAHLPVAIWTLHRLSLNMSSYQFGSRLRRLHECVAEVETASPGQLAGNPFGNGSAALADRVVEACSAFLHDPGVVEDRSSVLAFMEIVREPAATLLADAASLQIASCTKVLDDWQAELGDAWATVIAIVGVSAPTGPSGGSGPHLDIVRRGLGREAESTGRLLVAEGLHDPQLLRARLGTILANRRLATDWHGDAGYLERSRSSFDVSFALDALD